MHESNGINGCCLTLGLTCFLPVLPCFAQVDPEQRSLLEAGYDQPLKGQGPPGVYGFYYYNKPDFCGTNVALRLTATPVYLDSELGFKQLISPTTDFGIHINGGGWADSYYEVRQGKLIKAESFDGNGGGASLALYQLLNPGMQIPLNLVGSGGFHYATFETADQTAGTFVLPQDQFDFFTRVGLRLAGREPLLYPELGMELSAWYERQWRPNDQAYGFNDDRSINPAVDLYWMHAEITYTFTNSGQAFSVSLTAGGSTDADRLSAWRLGGMLPLDAEYPLMIPGYYNEELTAKRFVHLYAYYEFPLIPSQLFKFRIEGATANVEYLPGFEQGPWQSGAGCAFIVAPSNKAYKVILRYGYGFNAIRDGGKGAQSIGLLFQFDFEAPKKTSD